VAKSSWLLNEDIAFIYRAYATHDWPLKITSPSHMSAKSEVFDAGSVVTIRVDDSKFADWTKLELYDGATKVGELTKGPAKFTVKDLKAGYHAFSVLGTDGKRTIRPSNPVLVVVRELAEKPSATAEPGSGLPMFSRPVFAVRPGIPRTPRRCRDGVTGSGSPVMGPKTLSAVERNSFATPSFPSTGGSGGQSN
jgi:hypothetical protein